MRLMFLAFSFFNSYENNDFETKEGGKRLKHVINYRFVNLM